MKKLNATEKLELEIRRLRDEVSGLRLEVSKLKEVRVEHHFHHPVYQPAPAPYWTWPNYGFTTTSGALGSGQITFTSLGDDFAAGSPVLA